MSKFPNSETRCSDYGRDQGRENLISKSNNALPAIDGSIAGRSMFTEVSK
jgi:hypothetical protein